MRGDTRRIGAAERGLLPEGRVAGPMPWVIAIMMFLTVLAAAAGLGLASAAGRLDGEIGGRATVQIVEANPDSRAAQAAAAEAVLRALPEVRTARRLSDDELNGLLEPWIGGGGLAADLPVPALIDLDLTGPATPATLDRLRGAVAPIAPAARIDANAAWLGPLAALIGALQWLALGLVLLMIGATAATVVLAARAALDTHRFTIEILHLMGATDIQVARLFQRRIALDALFGGAIGLVLAAAVLLLLGNRVAALGSELLGSVTLPPMTWAILGALPVLGVILAILVARVTILRVLGRML